MAPILIQYFMIFQRPFFGHDQTLELLSIFSGVSFLTTDRFQGLCETKGRPVAHCCAGPRASFIAPAAGTKHQCIRCGLLPAVSYYYGISNKIISYTAYRSFIADLNSFIYSTYILVLPEFVQLASFSQLIHFTEQNGIKLSCRN